MFEQHVWVAKDLVHHDKGSLLLNWPVLRHDRCIEGLMEQLPVLPQSIVVRPGNRTIEGEESLRRENVRDKDRLSPVHQRAHHSSKGSITIIN
jgi:hypothetical protein